MGHLDFDNFIVAKYAYMLDFFRTAAFQDVEQNLAVTVFGERDANTQGYVKGLSISPKFEQHCFKHRM